MTTIDTATFRELQENAGPEFVTELVATFLEEAPLLLTELRESWSAKSAERFRRAAHSIKSNGQTFGATSFANLARELETGGLPVDTSRIDALDQEYLRVAPALTELCRG
jgi:HPt (histidine-containing phosphotransfer) domain-containing protein